MEKKNQFFIMNFYLIFLESLQIKIVINASPLTLGNLKQQPKPQIEQSKNVYGNDDGRGWDKTSIQLESQ